jgi:hypothetical protein
MAEGFCLDLGFMGKSTCQRRRDKGVRVVGILVLIYLSGWLPVTIAAYAAGRRLCDRYSPARHPLAVSLVAGALWPLLVVGLVELSSVMVYTKVQSKPGPGVGIFA